VHCCMLDQVDQLELIVHKQVVAVGYDTHTSLDGIHVEVAVDTVVEVVVADTVVEVEHHNIVDVVEVVVVGTAVVQAEQNCSMSDLVELVVAAAAVAAAAAAVALQHMYLKIARREIRTQ
jgi:hypothetical protein